MHTYYVKRLLFLSVFVVFGVAANLLFAGELIQNKDLLAKPKNDAAIVGIGSKGRVSLIAKKGFWVKIKAGNVEGWTRRNNLKTDSSVSGIGSLDTARLASGNIVSSSGARGLDAEDLVSSNPDYNEFEELEKYRVNSEQGLAFAKAGGLKNRSISYIVFVQESQKVDDISH